MPYMPCPVNLATYKNLYQNGALAFPAFAPQLSPLVLKCALINLFVVYRMSLPLIHYDQIFQRVSLMLMTRILVPLLLLQRRLWNLIPYFDLSFLPLIP